MRVAFVVREVMPEGGLSLAAFRLATALVESGHDAEVLYSGGEPPADLAGVGRQIRPDTAGGVSPSRLSRSLERIDPSVVLVGSGTLADLRAASVVAPTALHAHLHFGVCPDHSRYWSRLKRPCGVRAGWHCAVLRPVLGCSDLKQSVDRSHIREQRETLDALRTGAIGVVCVSTDQAELFLRHGVPEASVAVLPNLGIRATAGELDAASRETPESWRDATAFVGRLSKQKGGQLLGSLADSLPPETRFRIFGDGYLGRRLAATQADEVLCGHVSQSAVMGVLMWARSVVFPSLWPEPGGIVGVDAQVGGVPLAAFDVGAARYWPAARRFSLGDVSGMADWLAGREARELPRDPEAVAAAQRSYWRRIASRGAEVLGGFATSGRFGSIGGPRVEELIRPA